jgi:hypothetical protein
MNYTMMHGSTNIKGFSIYSFLSVFSEDGGRESLACLHILKARHSILCMENIGIDGLRDVCK